MEGEPLTARQNSSVKTGLRVVVVGGLSCVLNSQVQHIKSVDLVQEILLCSSNHIGPELQEPSYIYKNFV